LEASTIADLLVWLENTVHRQSMIETDTDKFVGTSHIRDLNNVSRFNVHPRIASCVQCHDDLRD
jgi:hypothetical protein